MSECQGCLQHTSLLILFHRAIQRNQGNVSAQSSQEEKEMSCDKEQSFPQILNFLLKIHTLFGCGNLILLSIGFLGLNLGLSVKQGHQKEAIVFIVMVSAQITVFIHPAWLLCYPSLIVTLTLVVDIFIAPTSSSPNQGIWDILWAV